jgi:hypothetical protein
MGVCFQKDGKSSDSLLQQDGPSATAEDRTLNTRNFPERRKFKRFKVARPAFVEWTVDPVSTGQILNISRDGLSFRYMPKGEKPKKVFQLKIYSSSNEFSIENIPVKTIFDLAMPLAFTVTRTTTRLRGVQFTALNPSQLSQLEHFIKNYAQQEEWV